MGQLSGWALRARGRISGVISGSDLLLRSGTGSGRAEYHCGVTSGLPVGSGPGSPSPSQPASESAGESVLSRRH